VFWKFVLSLSEALNLEIAATFPEIYPDEDGLLHFNYASAGKPAA